LKEDAVKKLPVIDYCILAFGDNETLYDYYGNFAEPFYPPAPFPLKTGLKYRCLVPLVKDKTESLTEHMENIWMLQ
jgi:hypothetical protein